MLKRIRKKLSKSGLFSLEKGYVKTSAFWLLVLFAGLIIEVMAANKAGFNYALLASFMPALVIMDIVEQLVKSRFISVERVEVIPATKGDAGIVRVTLANSGKTSVFVSTRLLDGVQKESHAWIFGKQENTFDFEYVSDLPVGVNLCPKIAVTVYSSIFFSKSAKIWKSTASLSDLCKDDAFFVWPERNRVLSDMALWESGSFEAADNVLKKSLHDLPGNTGAPEQAMPLASPGASYVRCWKEGDAASLISHKLTAKKDELIVTEDDCETSDAPLVIVWDRVRERVTSTSAAISIVCNAALDGVEAGAKVKIVLDKGTDFVVDDCGESCVSAINGVIYWAHRKCGGRGSSEGDRAPTSMDWFKGPRGLIKSFCNRVVEIVSEGSIFGGAETSTKRFVAFRLALMVLSAATIVGVVRISNLASAIGLAALSLAMAMMVFHAAYVLYAREAKRSMRSKIKAKFGAMSAVLSSVPLFVSWWVVSLSLLPLFLEGAFFTAGAPVIYLYFLTAPVIVLLPAAPSLKKSLASLGAIILLLSICAISIRTMVPVSIASGILLMWLIVAATIEWSITRPLGHARRTVVKFHAIKYGLIFLLVMASALVLHLSKSNSPVYAAGPDDINSSSPTAQPRVAFAVSVVGAKRLQSKATGWTSVSDSKERALLSRRYWRGKVLYELDGSKWERSLDIGIKESVRSSIQAAIGLNEVDATEVLYGVHWATQSQLKVWLERPYFPFIRTPAPAPAPPSSAPEPPHEEPPPLSREEIRKMREEAFRERKAWFDLSYTADGVLASTTQKGYTSPQKFSYHGVALLGQGYGLHSQEILQSALALSAENAKTQEIGKALADKYGNKDKLIVTHWLEWLNKNSVYDLDRTAAGARVNVADAFLFPGTGALSHGTCVDFATSTVIALRAAGIPARYVSGFYGGQWNGYLGHWVVSTSNAHAWVEYYSGSKGEWQRLDPTKHIDRTLSLPGQLSQFDLWRQAFLTSFVGSNALSEGADKQGGHQENILMSPIVSGVFKDYGKWGTLFLGGVLLLCSMLLLFIKHRRLESVDMLWASIYSVDRAYIKIDPVLGWCHEETLAAWANRVGNSRMRTLSVITERVLYRRANGTCASREDIHRLTKKWAAKRSLIKSVPGKKQIPKRVIDHGPN